MSSLSSEDWGTFLGFDNILLPLEGFAAEVKAAEVALYLAECSGGHVKVLHVKRPAVGVEEAYDELREWSIAKARELSVMVEVEEIVDEAPADAILERANAYDLVVMGGRRRLREEVFGGVSSKVVRGAPRPVMVVTSPIANLEEKIRPLKRILLPLRVGMEDLGAVKLAVALTSSATTRDFVIVALHVVTLPPATPALALDDESLEEEEKGFLREVGELSRLAARPIEPQVVVGRDAGRSIVSFARDHDFDLVVLGERDKPGPLGILLGTKALYVSRNSPCSVALVYKA